MLVLGDFADFCFPFEIVAIGIVGFLVRLQSPSRDAVATLKKRVDSIPQVRISSSFATVLPHASEALARLGYDGSDCVQAPR